MKEDNHDDGSKETKHIDQQPETTSENYQNAVFIMKAKGQSMEDFTEYCIKRFKEAGLIKEKT